MTPDQKQKLNWIIAGAAVISASVGAVYLSRQPQPAAVVSPLDARIAKLAAQGTSDQEEVCWGMVGRGVVPAALHAQCVVFQVQLLEYGESVVGDVSHLCARMAADGAMLQTDLAGCEFFVYQVGVTQRQIAAGVHYGPPRRPGEKPSISMPLSTQAGQFFDENVISPIRALPSNLAGMGHDFWQQLTK
jgi:hypothetical protein